MTTNDPVRWGIVGTGGIARRTVGDLRALPECAVAAVASRAQLSADAFAAEHGIALAYGDRGEMFSSGEVDAVYIGTPHTSHYAIAREAMLAGLHVVCEKPLSMTSGEAEELGALARERGVLLLEGMWMSFSPAMRRTLEILRSGEVGEPRILQAGLGFAVPAQARRYWDPELGGGALFDMGVYTITLACLVLGDVVAVEAQGHLQADGVDLEEAITLRFADSGLAQLMTSIVSFVPPRGWIGGTKGSIHLGERLFSPSSITVAVGRPPAPPEVRDEVFEQEGAGYLPMFRAAVEAIRAGWVEHPVHPHARTVDVLRTMETVQAALRSSD